MKKLLLMFLMFLPFTSTFCQITGVSFVKGRIVDTLGQPLRGAIVSLIRPSDSLLVKGDITDDGGAFILEKITAGDYFIRISFTGFSNYWTEKLALPEEGLALPSIALRIAAKLLTEVVVSAKKPVIEERIDGTVLNINDLVRKEAANAFEVLRFAPNVNLGDNEDNIGMNGKNNVEVMINGKIVRLSGRDLVNLLKSIPSGSVSHVDILTNPSSKYDVQGNAGIINIRMKRADPTGVNGSVSVSGSKSVNHMGDLSSSLNYGLGKLSLNTYLAYHYGRYRTQYTETRLANPSGIPYLLDRHNTSIDHWSDPVIRLGGDWFINSRNTIGALVELEKSSNKSSYNTITNIRRPGAMSDSSTYNSSSSPNARNWNTYNINYRFADTHNAEFVFDIDRSWYKKTDNNTLSNTNRKIYDPLIPQGLYMFNTKEIINIQTFKGDYTKTFPSKLKLEAGFKASFVDTRNNQLVQYNTASNISTDTSRTNFFLYKERVNAAYTTLGRKYKNWGFQAGVRVEHTDSKGVATTLKNVQTNKPDTSYLNMLPSAYLSFAPHTDHSLRLSFIKRIKRPAYEDLQPFDYQLDQYYYHIGNPGLRVQKNSNLELNYSFKNKLTLTAAYIQTKDYFTNVLYEQQGIVYESKQNTGKSNNFNAIVSYPIRPTKWWSADNRITVLNNHFEGALLEGYLNDNKWSCILYTSQRFVLPKEYILRITARYTSPQQRLYFLDGSNSSVGLSVSKQLLKKGTLRAGVSDIFKGQRTVTEVNFGSLQYTQRNTWESRSVFFEFVFKFGSTKIKEARDRETGNADETGRAK